ncbi:DUF6705 family protein [Kordia jejudonensis]|uniref:DUF6705 family protein n=1 Tax=Kordia jejudonensis TaxID=1348245 RepID=UPI000629066E|nr:DUF6705 family protein [Kordia jejudonensis]
MKNIIIIVSLIISSISCNAQNPIINLEDRGGKEQTNAYYKDINNVLNTFEGTWLYTNGATSLKIVLVKKTMYFNGTCYEDIIIGEYQYIRNGVELINTLTSLNDSTIDPYSRGIVGNSIYDNCRFLPVNDCVDGEKRLNLGLVDRLKPFWASLLLHKRVINGQTALRAKIVVNGKTSVNKDEVNPPPRPIPTLPYQGEYILIKQ